MIKNEIQNEINKLKAKYGNKKIKLNKEYWISGWSYDPLYEGYDVYKGIIVRAEKINGYDVYYTDRDCRYYFSWDIHTSRFNAEDISDLKNIYLYDWVEYGEENLFNR